MRADMRLVVVVCAAMACARPAAGGESDLSLARQALRDGLWQTARTHAEADGSETGRLIVLESFASEGRWDEVKAALARFGSASTNAAMAYYRAVVDGAWERAAALLRLGGSEAGMAEAKMLEADLLVRQGKEAEARRLWRDVLSLTNAGERAAVLAGVNLGGEKELRAAYARATKLPLRRMAGLRLGVELVRSPQTAAEGEALVRAIVQDSPDAKGAQAAFQALAQAEAASGDWAKAERTYGQLLETWPAAARDASVQEGRGDVFFRQGQLERALELFRRAETLAQGEAEKARVVLRQGDALSELGRSDEAMARYREVLERYPETETARALKRLFDLRELEARGRALYRDYRFEEARKVFAAVSEKDPSRAPRMAFLEVLCLYGLGRDEAARAAAQVLLDSTESAAVRSEVRLWLAKFDYNRGDWKLAGSRFVAFAEGAPDHPFAPQALLWAARSAFAANDYPLVLTNVAKLVTAYPSDPTDVQARIVQGEALIGLSRFDEAVLVLDHAASVKTASAAVRSKVRRLKADALFALGADNPARYQAALEAYRAIQFANDVSESERLAVAFKAGRTLEKLRRTEEAVDQYYTHVILAFRHVRAQGGVLDDEARAAFSKAAFRLADEFERRGRLEQSRNILVLVVESGVPAGEEAQKRLDRLSTKGRFL